MSEDKKETAGRWKKGPWHRRETESDTYICCDDSNLHIAVVPYLYPSGTYDADLIAAAPDLAEACADALADLEAEGRGDWESAKLLRAALAKARGEAFQ